MTNKPEHAVESSEDANATAPLPSNVPTPEQATLPLPAPTSDTSSDAERATLSLPAPTSAPEVERSTLPLPGVTSPTRSAVPTLPERIGRFAVRAWLGSGAFGDVYRDYDPQLDREVALKVAKPGTLNTPERVGRFLREAKAAANLRPPNIVPLYETGRDGDSLCITTAFIPGPTLESVIHETNEVLV